MSQTEVTLDQWKAHLRAAKAALSCARVKFDAAYDAKESAASNFLTTERAYNELRARVLEVLEAEDGDMDAGTE